MKDFAAELLAHKSIAYTFDFPEEELPQSLGMEFRRNLLLIYKELLHNIIKHAQARRVDITLTKSNGVLVLKVRDDGIGFEPELTRNGNGLRNMNMRASKLGGRIEFKTRPRAGTAATLTIKIP
jgi:signal transduction histidine kinase